MRVLRLRWKPFLQRTDAWRTSCSLSGEETMSSVLDAILSLKSWCLLDHAIHVCLADYVWFDVMKEWLSGFTGETMSSMFDAILSSKSGCWLDHVIRVYLAIYVIVLFMKEWHSWFTFSLITSIYSVQCACLGHQCVLQGSQFLGIVMATGITDCNHQRWIYRRVCYKWNMGNHLPVYVYA